MQSKQKLIELRAKIPYGGIKKISTVSGCSKIAVNSFFKSKLKNPDKIVKIQDAIINVLKEFKETDEGFYENVNNIMR